MSLLVTGSIALDTIRMPDGNIYKDVLGGSCTFFSYAASFFSKVQVVSVVGKDFRDEDVKMLESRGIDLQGLKKVDGATFRWFGTYMENMNDRRTDDLQFGVLGQFDPVLPDSYKDAEYVFLACAQPELQLKVLSQLRKKAFTVVDTIEVYIKNSRDVLDEIFKQVTGVIINESEATLLTGSSNLVANAVKLLDYGPSFVVVKKGEHGGILATRDGVFPFPGFPLLKIIDPTGAGDSFAGGFMGCVTKSRRTDLAGLRRATVFGSVMGSYACEGVGLDSFRKLTAKDVMERSKKFIELLRIPD